MNKPETYTDATSSPQQDVVRALGESEREKEAERRTLLLDIAQLILESTAIDATLSLAVFKKIKEPLASDVLFNYRLMQNGDLELLAEVGVPEELKPAAARLGIGQAFCGNVASTKSPLCANKERIASDSAGAFVLQMGVTAYACHPLFGRDGKVLGTFSVASTTRTEYLPSEIEFLQTVSHFMAIAWDRHQAEVQVAELSAESERRKRFYETILSNTLDLTYVFDLEHRFTYANKILLAMWGKTWDEAIGKTCLELGYEPWHAEMHSREIEQVKKTKLPIRGIVPFEGTFGRRIYDYIFVPILDENGEVEAVAGTTRDITELKQAQEDTAKRLENERQHAALLSKVADASQSLSRLMSAKSIARLIAKQARMIIGAHDAVVFISNPLEEVDLKAESFSRTEHETLGQVANNSLSVPLIARGGQRIGSLQLNHKINGEFTADDATILAQLAAIATAGIENATLYEKLQKQDRRKDEFIAMLAHELRNPLAPIRNAVAVLEQSTLSQSERKTLQMMERQIGHMVHLIDDLLDVSRISRGAIELRKETVKLDKIIQSALEVSKLFIASQAHEFIIRREEKDTQLEVDAVRVAQVITNLLNNAAKYTPKGGRIELITKCENNESIIQINDNGIGIAPEMTAKIFDLFTQVSHPVDTTQNGLGIGLAISKQLVEMHGGRMTAESGGLGAGAQFTIYLPVATQAAGTATSTPAAIKVPPRRVLVVDDNIDAADTLSMFLSMLGHEVKTSYNGIDAIESVSTYNPHLVLLDIGLPGMNGYEVAQKIIATRETQRPVLVALTGWGAMDDKQRAKDAGFDDHFTKPIELQKVTQLFEKMWGNAH